MFVKIFLILFVYVVNSFKNTISYTCTMFCLGYRKIFKPFIHFENYRRKEVTDYKEQTSHLYDCFKTLLHLTCNFWTQI